MRSPRNFEDGGIYHVMARGNEKQEIFKDMVDYQQYLTYLRKSQRKTEVRLYCFVLMPNHVHFLINTPEAGDLSRFMHSLQTAYSVYFNHKYKHSGHVFQGRFQSKVVSDDVYLSYLSKYIHRNPVEAGLVRMPTDYRWSSCSLYCQGVTHFDFIDASFLMGVFNDQYEKGGPSVYKRFIDDGGSNEGQTLRAEYSAEVKR